MIFQCVALFLRQLPEWSSIKGRDVPVQQLHSRRLQSHVSIETYLFLLAPNPAPITIVIQ